MAKEGDANTKGRCKVGIYLSLAVVKSLAPKSRQQKLYSASCFFVKRSKVELRKTGIEREGAGGSPKYNNTTPPRPIPFFWYFVFVFVGTRGIHNKAVIVLPSSWALPTVPPALPQTPSLFSVSIFCIFPPKNRYLQNFCFCFCFVLCALPSVCISALQLSGAWWLLGGTGGEAVEKQTAILCVVHGEKKRKILYRFRYLTIISIQVFSTYIFYQKLSHLILEILLCSISRISDYFDLSFLENIGNYSWIKCYISMQLFLMVSLLNLL